MNAAFTLEQIVVKDGMKVVLTRTEEDAVLTGELSKMQGQMIDVEFTALQHTFPFSVSKEA